MLYARRALKPHGFPTPTTLIVCWIILLLCYSANNSSLLFFIAFDEQDLSHTVILHDESFSLLSPPSTSSLPSLPPASSLTSPSSQYLSSASTLTSTPLPPPSISLPSGIPKKIWYKLGPNGLNDQTEKWTQTCITQNPEYQVEFFTDASSETWVRKTFISRPDIVTTYTELSIPIHKADLLRYLILYAEGGIWSDLDVSCDVPIRDWIPNKYNNAGLVVGWEFDMGHPEDLIREFATWTLMAKPGSPHLMTVIEDILDDVRSKTKEHQVTIVELTLNMTGDVVSFTGPRRITRSIFKSLESEGAIDRESIEFLQEPKMVRDVLVMPAYSFAFTINNYVDEDTQGPILATHHFAGSWKNDRGGEQSEA